MAKKLTSMKAWLVTWEWCGTHAKRADKIAAVFSPRLGAERIRALVEFLYMQDQYTVGERMAFVLRNRPNPYPAEFGSAPDGVPWTGQVSCGHNPFLQARLADDLSVECDLDGNEKVTWKERPKPWEQKIGRWSERAIRELGPEGTL
jgi:hypothetical protein